MIDEQWKACTGANLIKMIVFKFFKEKKTGKKKVIVKMIDYNYKYNDIRSIVIRIHVYFVIQLKIKGDIFVIISLNLTVWISIFSYSFNCQYIFRYGICLQWQFLLDRFRPYGIPNKYSYIIFIFCVSVCLMLMYFSWFVFQFVSSKKWIVIG